VPLEILRRAGAAKGQIRGPLDGNGRREARILSPSPIIAGGGGQVSGSGIVLLDHSKEQPNEHAMERVRERSNRSAGARKMMAGVISASTGSCAQGIIPA